MCCFVSSVRGVTRSAGGGASPLSCVVSKNIGCVLRALFGPCDMHIVRSNYVDVARAAKSMYDSSTLMIVKP